MANNTVVSFENLKTMQCLLAVAERRLTEENKDLFIRKKITRLRIKRL
jgi:hypothetical protein